MDSWLYSQQTLLDDLLRYLLVVAVSLVGASWGGRPSRCHAGGSDSVPHVCQCPLVRLRGFLLYVDFLSWVLKVFTEICVDLSYFQSSFTKCYHSIIMSVCLYWVVFSVFVCCTWYIFGLMICILYIFLVFKPYFIIYYGTLFWYHSNLIILYYVLWCLFPTCLGTIVFSTCAVTKSTYSSLTKK